MLPIPADMRPGSYYVIGRADWNSAVVETAEANNDRISGLIRIGGDLVVSALTAPSTATLSGPIAVTDSTKNQGPAPVPESVTAFYLSLNGTYDATDQLLGTRIVGALGGLATNTATTNFAVPAGIGAGSYYVIAVADANGAVAESLENNNTRLTSAVKIGPDFTVTALTGAASAVAGTSISVTDTTKNQGMDTAPASVTSFYLSSNSTLDAGDLFLGSRDVASLGVGLTSVGSATLPIPVATAAGSYYIIAKSDGPDAIAEAVENNNTRAKTVTITAAPSS
jgi:subtilase family serine protease